MSVYDPFVAGPFPVEERTIQALDPARGRTCTFEIWSPAAHSGPLPLVVFSHRSGGHRRAATFLCSHLSSHGYLVAAMDHSPASADRLLDMRFILDHLDPAQVGLVGHSLGGWTVLATPDSDPGVRAVVALAPGGNSNPKPGILRAKLPFQWGRDVPTLLLVADGDVCLPLDGMYEIFARTPATKQLVVLRRADHMHFMDNVEEIHEAARKMDLQGELAWIPKEMRPISELCSGEQSHLFVRGLALCHMDAHLKQHPEAERFLRGDIAAELSARGVDAFVHPS